MSISPASGCTAPISTLIRVLLPAPLSPTSATISPERNVRSTLESATTLAYFFEIPRIPTIGVVAAMVALTALDLARQGTLRGADQFAYHWDVGGTGANSESGGASCIDWKDSSRGRTSSAHIVSTSSNV